jgi:hypothetical protein
LGFLDLLGARRDQGSTARGSHDQPVFPTKAFSRFLTTLTSQTAPVLLDLGPVVGSNVSYFGEQLGCKIFVEDLFADLNRHVREDTLDLLPEFFRTRLGQSDNSIDGVLCWDLFDYLPRPAAQALAAALTRVMRPDGALLGFFSTVQRSDIRFTKYVIVDDKNLKHRRYETACTRHDILLNRDIIKLFPGLHVSESFLLLNKQREILFRKPV